MFSLCYKLNDELDVNGFKHKINASFDNILKIIDLLNEKNIGDHLKIRLALQMLFGKETELLKLSIEEQNIIFHKALDKYIQLKGDQAVQYDLAGNPLPVYKKEQKNFYSLKYDASYIYASFIQAYGIDLIEQQGILHWHKFQALLAGLPEDTKFRQVVSIRMWKKPNKSDTEEKQMRELQEIYRLPDEEVEL